MVARPAASTRAPNMRATATSGPASSSPMTSRRCRCSNSGRRPANMSSPAICSTRRRWRGSARCAAASTSRPAPPIPRRAPSSPTSSAKSARSCRDLPNERLVYACENQGAAAAASRPAPAVAARRRALVWGAARRGKLSMIRKFLIVFAPAAADGRAGGMARGHVGQFHRLQRGQRAGRARFRREARTFPLSCCGATTIRTQPAPGPRCGSSCFQHLRRRAHGRQPNCVAGYYVRDARALMLVGTRATRAARYPPAATNRDPGEHPAPRICRIISCSSISRPPIRSGISEGFAEFWGATRFLPNDVVEVGRRPITASSSFRAGRWLPLGRLLSAQNYADVPRASTCSMPKAGCSSATRSRIRRAPASSCRAISR